MLDKSIKTSICFFDEENKMMLSRPKPWNPSDRGEGDAIGRNLEAYYTYNDTDFLTGIYNCFEQCYANGKFYLQGHRYPTWMQGVYMKGISRDHISYAICAYKLAFIRNPLSGSYLDLKEITSMLRWRISDFASFTPNMWCWMKYVGGSFFYGFLYYLMEIPNLLINLALQKLVYKVFRLENDVHPTEWKNTPKSDKKKVTLPMPVFAIHNCSWQVKVLPDSFFKRILQKILLKMTPEYNYVVRMLNGDYSFSYDEIKDIKQMTGGIWTASLNPRINDRFIEEVDCSVNCLEIDYLMKLWEERK